MVQHVLSTLPRRNKWNVSSHRRFSPHSYWQVHNLACLWSEYKKSALTECPHKYPSLKTSDVPKIIDIKALPSYNYNERELCFCKAMVGREKTNKKTFKCNQVFVLFAIKSVPVSLTKSFWVYAITSWVFFDHAIRHRSWMLVKAEKGCFLFFFCWRKIKIPSLLSLSCT